MQREWLQQVRVNPSNRARVIEHAICGTDQVQHFEIGLLAAQPPDHVRFERARKRDVEDEEVDTTRTRTCKSLLTRRDINRGAADSIETGSDQLSYLTIGAHDKRHRTVSHLVVILSTTLITTFGTNTQSKNSRE
jgi:hypothetical protein